MLDHSRVSSFGDEVRRRASSSVLGNPEDALRGPTEQLFEGLAADVGYFGITIVPEVSNRELSVRPDMAIVLDKELIGHIELKAPGKGADPRRFPKGHDREQWKKLQALPNLVYFDGAEISLWRFGAPQGEIVAFSGRPDVQGKALTAPAALEGLIVDFLIWAPQTPRNVPELATTAARLCRLLRDEVLEQLALGEPAVRRLGEDWKQVLIPEASDVQFADGYAQAATFGLLVARARGIDVRKNIRAVAQDLASTDALMGTALDVLVGNPTAFRTSLGTLVRVLSAVDWDTVSRGDPEAWLYFYEPFLRVYDLDLLKKTGTYYTPPEVVEAMVRLADEALRDPSHLDLPGGLPHPDVTLVDPATGTGTFPLAVLRRLRDAVARDQGPGAVRAAIAAAAPRIVGFELQFGPFVVAQLRLLAELMKLTGDPKVHPRLFVADTLSDPDHQLSQLPSLFGPLTDSYKAADDFERDAPVTAVIGNPPYDDRAEGRGGWVENGRRGETGPLADWAPGAADSVHARHLRNLYVYFWRWAAWKAWGGGAGAGEAPDRRGVVSFITVAGFLNGPGFKVMRADLRAEADEIWVIDGSPEGHQPEAPTRIFQAVQQPVCIVMALRRGREASGRAARLRFRRLPKGPRADKFAALAGITLDGEGWTEVAGDDPGASFLPAAEGEWGRFVPVGDMFGWDGTGVMIGRTWVVAPDSEFLRERWARLKEMIRPPADRLVRKGFS